ncbi:MAG: alpha-hydroxy-acid oxidizing protein [Clostridium sp.]|jgi:isopentenyl diphosphate isomerase/L-lactate dehydrogenase-like FMN-dependent dehydrogenase|nr:alpha-hydroxy-acid oxidizing protein [Clostridium sp.]
MDKERYAAGDSNRITREYFDSLLVEMRHLDNVRPDTAVTVFRERFRTPVMMAALSHLSNVRENGMAELAKGAAAAGACMWCGMGEEQELEEVAATGAKTVKIIKPYANREVVYRKMEHARQCGAVAVGMDIDHQFGADGQYDNVMGLPMKAVSTEELKGFVRAAGLPFVVKGVLSVQDAVKCVQAGVSAIVVSHHHGILRYAVPPLMVLPEIQKAVQGKLDVFVDCGIESGMDVFKALALGADAVSVGRGMMEALRESGAAGVTEKINRMTTELAGVMARTGIPDIGRMDPWVIRTGDSRFLARATLS